MSASTSDLAPPTDAPLPGCGQMPPLDEALTAVQQRAERAGFLRGLGVAAGICEDPNQARRACCFSTCLDLGGRILSCDGLEGEAVREHCAQFAWSGEGEEQAG